MVDPRRALGTRGEALAVALLEEAGLTVVETNWRCPAGELDIVARERAVDYSTGCTDASWLVFVEVRTRRGMRYGSARESVTRRKQAKLRQLAHAYVLQKQWQGPWRIDVVAIQLQNGHPPQVEHLRHAVIDE